MPDVTFAIYDTWQPSTTANAQQTLFQVSQGGDATHTPSFTNMRGAGSFPQTEKMVVNKISVTVDKALPIADLSKWFYGSILELIVANTSLLQIPVAYAIDNSAWEGSLVEASAADTPTVGLWGDGWELVNPITIGGAIPFKVNMTQNLALSATTNIKVSLIGTYSIA